MNPKRYFLAATSLLMLAGCSGPTPLISSAPGESSAPSPTSSATSAETSVPAPSSTSEEPKPVYRKKEVRHANLSYLPFSDKDPRFFDEEPSLDSLILGNLNVLYEEGQEEIPYLRVKDYAELLKSDFIQGVTIAVTENDGSSTLTVKNGDKVTATYVFDPKEKTSSRLVNGLENCMKPIGVLGNSVELYLDMKVEVITEASTPSVSSWIDVGFETVTYEGETWYPLSLLDLELSREDGRFFCYDSAHSLLYELGDTHQFGGSSFTIMENGQQKIRTADKYLGEAFAENYNKPETSAQGLSVTNIVLPEYFVAYNRDAFRYIMGNYYGLCEAKGIRDILDYIDATTYAEDFMNLDGRTRGLAYANFIFSLNDNHSSYSGASIAEEASPAIISPGQSLANDRLCLSRILQSQREAVLKAEDKSLKDVRYSTDGKTAYFSFDSFDALEFEKDKGIPEAEKENDTYLFFVKNLKEIKEKGGVDTVVIDDSVNGGGYVWQMAKLLALMSKNNTATLYWKSAQNDAITRFTAKADINLDGKIDENDVSYGNDFRFFILTSSFSFSCGNAFPCYAQDLGIGQTIGAKSGGGECVVETNFLPYSSVLTHSSPYRIGFYNAEDDTYRGYENGAVAETIYTGNYYKVDDVAAALPKKK